MGLVALRQTGILPHLPELPVRTFRSESVVLSKTAFALGVPDATLSVASMAANIPLAAAGGANRAERLPWLPVLASAVAGAQSMASLWYLRREKALCSYCLIAAAANFVVFGLTVPELLDAVRQKKG